MADPYHSDDTVGEYFELYNCTDSNIYLDTWYYADDGGEKQQLSGTIALYDFFVIVRNSEAPIEYDLVIPMVLANTSDEIKIYEGDPDDGGRLITAVYYNDSNPFGSGVACELITIEGHDNGILGDSDFQGATNLLSNGDKGSPSSLGSTPIRDWILY